MGDTEPGSSNAAQSAPMDPTLSTATQRATHEATLGKPHWWRRLADKLPSKSVTTESPNDSVTAFVPGHETLNLGNLRLDDVAIPTVEIVAVPSDITKDDLVQVFRDSGMSRLPVYDGTLDSPIGLVHLKDFALTFGFNGTDTPFNLRDTIRPLLYVPPSMPVGVLLQKMQTERMHMALMIDEYGGVDGLVTLEDLIEQVIGEIEDEHDIEEDAYWIKSAPGVFVAQAKAPLEEFEAEIGMKLSVEDEEEEIDTLGGLVFMLCGRVPARGEVIPHPNGSEFEIVDADPRRIKRIRVRLPAAVKPKAEA